VSASRKAVNFSVVGRSPEVSLTAGAEGTVFGKLSGVRVESVAM